MTDVVTGSRRRVLSASALLSVVWWLSVVEIGVRLVSLDRLARFLGARLQTAPTDEHPASTGRGAGGPDTFRLRQLRALDRVAPHWPFCDGPCLRQALVVVRIVRRHDPVLCIGAEPSADGVRAHAWVEVGGQVVGSSRGDFLPLTGGGDVAAS